MDEVEDLLGCMMKHDFDKTILRTYQPCLVNKMTQRFNENVKSLMTFNNPSTPHEGIIINQETDPQIS